MVKGIGPILAKKLVGRFGAEARDIIQTENDYEIMERIYPVEHEATIRFDERW